eukprot:scaffold5454_cov135-Skeletonema_menzelii.AAC.1
MDACPHLRKPTECAWQRLRDPLQWKCDSCLSTDGIWICLTCGHIGCGRRAHLPALGGGHSKHHYHTTHGNTVVTSCKTAIDDSSSNDSTYSNHHGTKKSKIMKIIRRSPRNKHKIMDKEEENEGETIAPNSEADSKGEQDEVEEDADNSRNGHEVCIDIVTKAVHCYACDDYILSDEKWLAELREELVHIELSKDAMSISTTSSSSTTDDEPPDELVLTEATHALLRVLWSGRWRSIKPRYFVNAVWKHGGLFAARKQQDANEFLNFYVARVDDELKAPKAKNSVMMDLFGVDQFQQVQCDECRTVTKRTEPLLGLVLSLPDDKGNNEDSDDSSTQAPAKAADDRGNNIDLLDCVKSLRNSGRFTGDDKFDCETCKEKKDASWNVTLQKRPQSLLISFRRTLWTIEKGVHKDSRQVRFPLKLDASEILDVGSDSQSPDDDFESCHYNLTSIVSHSGSTPFVGHYIAYARNGHEWFLFNDSSVTEVKESEVLEAEAFILLYERSEIPAV